MADPRAQQAGGDNSNEESKQAIPPVNDSKGKGKLVFPPDTDMDIPSSSSSSASSTGLKSSEQSNGKEWTKQSSQVAAEWDDPLAVDLQKLLVPHIKDFCQTAMKQVVDYGYSDEEAEWAVLSSGIYLGYLDITANIVNGALALLACTDDFDPSTRPLFDGLERLASYILLEMVCVLKEVKPFLTVYEAMWRLLLCDLNVFEAVEYGTANQFSSHDNHTRCSCCSNSPSQFRNEVIQAAQKLNKDHTRERIHLQLQGEDAVLKGKGAKLQIKLKREFQAAGKHEERGKKKFVSKAEAVKNETEGNMVELDELVKKLSAEISALKLEAALGDDSGQGGAEREGGCVMCLIEERTIVFLPCAHRVLCEKCSFLHENQGMKDCPTCRTPITQRINVRFPPPKPR